MREIERKDAKWEGKGETKIGRKENGGLGGR